jgi:PKD repeat protein
VIFDATGSSAGVTTWTWDFGDGTAAGSGQKTTHTFSLAGTWVVRLTVSDATGRTATITDQVTVSK